MHLYWRTERVPSGLGEGVLNIIDLMLQLTLRSPLVYFPPQGGTKALQSGMVLVVY